MKKPKKKPYSTQVVRQRLVKPVLATYYLRPQTQEELQNFNKSLHAQGAKPFFLPVGYQGPETGGLRGLALGGFYSDRLEFDCLKLLKNLDMVNLRVNNTWYAQALVDQVLVYETVYQICSTMAIELSQLFQGLCQAMAQNNPNA